MLPAPGDTVLAVMVFVVMVTTRVTVGRCERAPCGAAEAEP